MTTQQKIFLLGGGGVPNYGDELIIHSWLKWYARDLGLPGRSITVSGSHRTVLQKLFGDAYPGVKFSQRVREARWRPETTFYESVSHGYGYLSDPEHADSPLHRELRGTTVFHLHGGGYLNSKWPTHGFMLGIALWAKENLGCRLVGTGLGLGPMQGPDADDEVTARAFRAFDILEVRDEWSFDFLKNHDLHDDPVFGYDDAFLQPLHPARRHGSTLHLSLRHDEAGAKISRWIPQRFVESFDHHVFWSCTGQDAGAFVALSKRFPFFELAGNRELLFDLPVSKRDFMIAQRFHPHLVGARLDMQGMFRTGSDYYDIKHRLVTDLGSPFVLGDLEDLKKAPIAWEPSKMALKSADYVADKRQLASRILPGVGFATSPNAVQLAGHSLGQLGRRIFKS